MAVFKNAVVRLPGAAFARALSSGGASPDVDLAQQQHAAYRAALEECGVRVTVLPADERFPDGVFVEDTAIIDGARALIARPGHPSRRKEASLMAAALRQRFHTLSTIVEPGTLDGGDVCIADDVVFVGLSERTNGSGIDQLRSWCEAMGKRVVAIDLANAPGLLHLKTGMAFVGERTMVAAPAIAGHRSLNGYRTIGVPAEHPSAANCVSVNGRILVDAAYPMVAAALASHGFSALPLDISEFAKMDGGLSCLSLRY